MAFTSWTEREDVVVSMSGTFCPGGVRPLGHIQAADAARRRQCPLSRQRSIARFRRDPREARRRLLEIDRCAPLASRAAALDPTSVSLGFISSIPNGAAGAGVSATPSARQPSAGQRRSPPRAGRGARRGWRRTSAAGCFPRLYHLTWIDTASSHLPAPLHAAVWCLRTTVARLSRRTTARDADVAALLATRPTPFSPAKMTHDTPKGASISRIAYFGSPGSGHRPCRTTRRSGSSRRLQRRWQIRGLLTPSLCFFSCQHRARDPEADQFDAHGADGFRIVFEFEIFFFDGTEYRITRTAAAGQDAECRAPCCPAPGVGANQWVDLAADLKPGRSGRLCLAFEAFRSSVLLRQG